MKLIISCFYFILNSNRFYGRFEMSIICHDIWKISRDWKESNSSCNRSSMNELQFSQKKPKRPLGDFYPRKYTYGGYFLSIFHIAEHMIRNGTDTIFFSFWRLKSSLIMQFWAVNDTIFVGRLCFLCIFVIMTK